MRKIGEYIIRLTLSALILSSLYGCKGSEEELLADKPADKPSILTLNVALSVPIPKENGVPVREQVKELRLILIDKTTKEVEFNEQLDLNKLNTGDGKIRYIYELKNINTKVGAKYLCALANAEALIKDILPEETSGKGFPKRRVLEKDFITQLKACQIGENFFVKPEDGGTDNNIPITSKLYEFTLNGSEAKQEYINGVYTYTYTKEVNVDMVYAAVKFDFDFVLGDDLKKKLQIEGKQIQIVKWMVSEVASDSYLLPHMNSTQAWNDLVAMAGTSSSIGSGDKVQWITDYSIPKDIPLIEYEKTYDNDEIVLSDNKAQHEDPATYYMHESKSLRYNKDEQEYSLNLGIRVIGGKEAGPKDSKEDLPIILSQEFPHLKSLVRGTHVRVTAKITAIPEPGKNGLEIKVSSWKEEGPVDGGWTDKPLG